jgi:nucleoside-diphosphate-sugar epimerase
VRLILTGAGSFTGFWFARALAEAGHEVIAPLRGALDGEGRRGRRLAMLADRVRLVPHAPFGSEAFAALIAEAGPLDVLCHHGAQVGDYRSPSFDPFAAAEANLHRPAQTLEALAAAGCRRMVLTGSVFEADEGAGSHPMRAFSAYGLSKTLTGAAAAYYAGQAGVRLDKFVIPNPFGPHEEPRFTDYLMRTWLGGAAAECRTPLYVRDNVPVSLLALAYADFVGDAGASPAPRRLNPSFYPESQGAFALRVSREVAERLGRPCPIALGRQTAFDEPAVRINTDLLDPARLGWDEAAAWDAFVGYYRGVYGCQ